MKKFKVILILTLVVSMMASLAGCGSKEKVINIGHKNYTEQRIVGAMFALMIEEHTDYKAKTTELGGTSVCFEALKNNQIDVYPEFTGTGYSVVLKQKDLRDPDEVYQYCYDEYKKQYNMTWLKPLGYNNTYTMTIRKETAEKLGIKTISELVSHTGDLVLGAEAEFLSRQDGLVGLKEVYGIDTFKEEKAMDIGLTYAALKEGQIDINDAFSTDGRIKKFDLVSLIDDKQFFLPYYCSPLVTEKTMKEYPEVVEALNKLGGHFTDADMQEINLLVDEGADAKKVAKEKLVEKGLIKE